MSLADAAGVQLGGAGAGGVKEVLQEACRGQSLQLWLVARSGAQDQSFYGEQMCRFNMERVECGG